MSDFPTIQDELLAFRDEREWRQFHTPKDLAISVSLEAAELLECFQWSGADTGVGDRREQVAEELADVMIYCLFLADAAGIDPLEAIERKLEQNRAKYPVEKARGSSRKYTEL